MQLTDSDTLLQFLNLYVADHLWQLQKVHVVLKTRAMTV